MSTVLYEATDGVALVTLNRPNRGNAWTGRMEVQYRAFLARAAGDPAVRVIVITGAGERFCVGADSEALEGISEAGRYDAGVREPLPTPPGVDHAVGRHSFLWALGKPVIAAVNGAAAGLGFGIVCFADLRFAAEGAELATSFVRLGLPAEFGLSWILPRLVGASTAAELLLTGRVVEAEEAVRMGLVHRVFPKERLLSETMATARRLARECAPTSLRVIKEQLYADLRRDLASSEAVADNHLEQMVTTPEFREGVAALLERRPPDFLNPAARAE